MKHAKRPTVIDRAEVFDSAGTLALMVNGYDVLHLELLEIPFDVDLEEKGNRPSLTPEEHQKIIDAICEALGVRTW